MSLSPIELGKRLKAARKNAKLSQSQAADVINTSQATVSWIECGKQTISEDRLAKLAASYKVTVAELLCTSGTGAMESAVVKEICEAKDQILKAG